MPVHSTKNRYRDPIGLRITLYKSTKLLVLFASVALIIKGTLFDSFYINGDQMSPTVVRGDRIVLLRFPFLPLVRTLFKPHNSQPVVFTLPVATNPSNLLRIAAQSGDTVWIDSGTFFSSSTSGSNTVHQRNGSMDIVPKEYIPRDFFEPYRIPARGDEIITTQLTLRDFFFARSLIQQENPKSVVTIKPLLIIDDSLTNDYIITDFALYTGALDSVPESYRYSWFFWNRLQEYLYRTIDEKKVALYFSLNLDGAEVKDYQVRQQYLFLLADNWEYGLDSRSFGPIVTQNCIGKAFMVLWSNHRDKSGKRHFQFNRLGRFIR